jgi:hypothetical protein
METKPSTQTAMAQVRTCVLCTKAHVWLCTLPHEQSQTPRVRSVSRKKLTMQILGSGEPLSHAYLANPCMHLMTAVASEISSGIVCIHLGLCYQQSLVIWYCIPPLLEQSRDGESIQLMLEHFCGYSILHVFSCLLN